MTNLLLLADGPGMAYRVLRAAADTGATVFVLGEPRAQPLAASRFCKGLTAAPQRFDAPDPEPVVLEINRLVVDLNIDMVLPGDPATSRFVAHARRKLAAPAFPGPDPETFEMLNDNWRFTQLVTSLGFTCPATRLLPNRGALADAIARELLPTPAMAKPLSASGGAGVLKLEPKTLEAQLGRIDYTPVLWQRFVNGLDLELIVYCEAGEVLSFVACRREQGVYAFGDSPEMRRQLETLAAHLTLTGLYNFEVVTDATLEDVYWLACIPGVFHTMDVLSFVGFDYIACGLPGARKAESRARHDRVLRAIAGRHLRRWNALARDTPLTASFSPRD